VSETVSPVSDYVATKTFAELPLSEELRRGIAEKGYTAPTPVQAAVLEPILAGKDLIVRSKTGTGKTAAFGIPLLERIPAGTRHVAAVILCNTRELALQVSQEIIGLGAHKGLGVVAIYGGASMDEQVKKLQDGAAIVVGTPGRVQDLYDRGRLKFDKVQMAVLDEADEMLGAGFFEDVTRILETLPKTRQTLLFSATVPPDIEQLVQKFLREPETVLLSGDVYTVEHIQNVLYDVVDQYPKPRNLLYLLERENPDSAIIFCNTRTDTELIANVLNRHGLDAEMLNGDLPQKERERVMARIKRGELRFMVATDLAARGIDISDLSHVINYSLPEDPAVYLHRVGRTGRIGKKGTAISLFTGAEMVTLTALEKRFNIPFEKRKLPTPEEAKGLWTERQLGELSDAMQSGSAFEAYLPLAKEMAERSDRHTLLAYALKYFFTHHRMERAQARAAGERLEQKHEAAEVVQEAKERRRKGDKPERKRRERGEAEGRPPREKRERRERPEGAAADPAASATTDTAPGAQGAGDAPAAPEAPAAPIDRVKLFVSQGAEQGWEAETLAQGLSQLAGQGRETVLAIDLKPRHAYVLVRPDVHAAYLEKSGQALREQPVTIEVARPRRR
jgi:ATP-dependent RNA helicase DeaD